MKKIISIIAILAFSLSVWAQQQDTMFVHTGQTVHEFATKDVDSITPKLGATENLDSLLFYKNSTIINRFQVNKVDSIIFYRAQQHGFMLGTE